MTIKTNEKNACTVELSRILASHLCLAMSSHHHTNAFLFLDTVWDDIVMTTFSNIPILEMKPLSPVRKEAKVLMWDVGPGVC